MLAKVFVLNLEPMEMLSSLWDDPAVLIWVLIGVLIANTLWSIYLLLREVILRVIPNRLFGS